MTDKTGEILVSVDIGTSKTCVLIGEVTEEGLDILGCGTAPTKGVQKGVITNKDSAAQAVSRALEVAEAMAGFDSISNVIVNITGNHIQGINSSGVAPVYGDEGVARKTNWNTSEVASIKTPEINRDDVTRVLESAKARKIQPDHEFLHVLPQEYILDDQPGIRSPIGMNGVRVEAKGHIVRGAISSANNIIECINRCHLNVDDLVYSALASSAAVLSDDEKEIGCALVDIGSGTTDIAIWHKGALVHTHVLGVGGNHLTSDIAKGLQISIEEAETLKINDGCAMTSAVGADEIIQVPSPGDRRETRKISRQGFAEIIEPRLEEIFLMVNREIEKSGYKDKIPAGIILTGGTSIMDAAPELGAQTMNMPVHRGIPCNVGGMSDCIADPRYATAVGLLLYEMNRPDVSSYNPQETQKSSWIGRIVTWLKQII